MPPIVHNHQLLGIKVDKITPGSKPITDPKEFIQMVTLKHPRGTSLPAHYHKPRIRRTTKLQECLIVKKGKVKLSLYSPEKKLVKKIILKTGQAFIALNGGLGLTVIDDAEIIEIKNGPFKTDKVLIANEA